jgi:hypothetical protein
MSQTGPGNFPSGITIRHSRSYAQSGCLWMEVTIEIIEEVKLDLAAGDVSTQ